MNVTSWDTEQNSQTLWKDGRRRARERERKRREEEGQKILSDRRNKNMIPSGDGNTENMNVKRWKQSRAEKPSVYACVVTV